MQRALPGAGPACTSACLCHSQLTHVCSRPLTSRGRVNQWSLTQTNAGSQRAAVELPAAELPSWKQVVCRFRTTQKCHAFSHSPYYRGPGHSHGQHLPHATWQHVRQQQPVQCQAAASASSQPGGGGSSQTSHGFAFNPKLLVGVALTLLFGVTNRVLYKMALVPMHNYVFFLAQFQNIGYLTVYFTTLWLRYRAGLVTAEMLKCDKRPLWAIGACEAVAQLLFMVSASHLPGPLLPVINQSYLVWNLLFAALFLHTRFTGTQIAGAALIVLGVVLAAAPPALWSMLLGSASTWGVGLQSATGAAVEPVYVLLGVLCFAFPALASIIKDMIFRRERERLGQPLDIFMVNSFGSLYQAVFVLLLLPITSALYGVRLPDLPAYLAAGAKCFQGLAPACGADCTGAPLLPVAYVAANLAFNVAMLTLLRSVGTVTTTIVGSCLVPLTILAFTLPLPILPPSSMSPSFVVGAALLCLGLLVYNYKVILEPLVSAMASPRMTPPSKDRPQRSPSEGRDPPDESVDLPAP